MTDSKQITLTGDSPTRVGHSTKDSRTTAYIGRDRRDGELKHMNNTPIGKRGWIGNPYPKDDYGRAECIELFRADFEDRLEDDDEFRAAVANLKGEVLGCWCQRLEDDGPACHGEVVAEWAERLGGDDGE